jgi:hypothetical protein
MELRFGPLRREGVGWVASASVEEATWFGVELPGEEEDDLLLRV